MPTPARVRIAPSPTGDPHVGTAYTGLFNWMLARQTGGQFILRIEDTDRQRSTNESEEAILRSLRWLGLEYDEGPDVEGPYGPYRQSERSELYRTHVRTLIENGSAYPCFCTAERLSEMRALQRKEKRDPGYDGQCRSIPADEAQQRMDANEPYVIRLKVDKQGATVFQDHLRGEIRIENRTIDDQVLMKSDGFPTYHLANVVDDHLMKITHVLRAEEWITSTPKHVLLYQAFGWDLPVFCHLPLLRNSDKSKISKRKNPTSLDHYREKGYLPEAMLNFLALMGFSPAEGEGEEVFTQDELRQVFSLDRISLGGPVFDLTKLDWLNGNWIRRLDRDDLTKRIQAAIPEGPATETGFIHSVLPLVQERMKTILDYADLTDFFLAPSIHLTNESFRRAKLPSADLVRALERAHAILSEVPDLDPDRDSGRLREGAVDLGLKVGGFFMALRVAVTGKSATPPLIESMQVIGRDQSLARIQSAIDFLQSESEL